MNADESRTELEKIAAAIAAQEALRGILADDLIEAVLAGLQQKQAVLLAAGSGAIAAGEGNKAVGSRRVNVDGDVAGNINTGDKYYLTIDLPDPVARATVQCLKRLRHRCHALPLAELGGSDVSISLDNVYIALDTLTTIPIDAENTPEDVRDSRLREAQETRRVSALEAVTAAPRMVLRGDPGGGKSSFVKYLAAWLATVQLDAQAAPDGWEPLLPLVLTVRLLGEELRQLQLDGLSGEERKAHLLDALHAAWQTELDTLKVGALSAHVATWLTDGRVLLVLDGLDEVPEDVRGLVRETVYALLESYPQVARVIVTCRTRSYTGAAQIDGFERHTLAPFDEDKIRAFVAAWYNAQGATLPADRLAQRIADLQRVATRPPLLELATNPMLLTTMALIHQREAVLPRERARLYSQAVELLLFRWQKRIGHNVSDELGAVLDDEQRLRRLLERLAYETHARQADRDGATELSRGDALLLLETPGLLDDIGLAGEFLDYVDHRSGLLIGHGGDTADGGKPQLYGFPHRTFQEYLAGCYLVTGRTVARSYRQRAAEGDFWTVAAQLGTEELLYNNPQGRPQFLDLAYGLCAESDPVDETGWRTALWSGQMATLIGRAAIEQDGKEGGEGVRYWQRLTNRLVQALGDSPLRSAERAEAGRILGKMGDPRPQVMTLDGLQLCLVPGGPFWMGSRDDDSQAQDDEKPLHEVDLPTDYWIGRYPVTNAQFAEFVAAGGYESAALWPEAQRDHIWRDGLVKGWLDSEWRAQPMDFGDPFALPNHPVVGVMWYEALAFTRWLTGVWRADSILPADWAVRLPSETEWAKAARGGVTILNAPHMQTPAQGKLTATQRVRHMVENPRYLRSYPWGDAENRDRVGSNLANYGAEEIGSSSTPGVFPGGVSPYGCGDLSGNVWEWTRSQFKEYPYAAEDGREQLTAVTPSTGVVLRGSGSRRPLLTSRPLRTTRASFPASRSSLTNAPYAGRGFSTANP